MTPNDPHTSYSCPCISLSEYGLDLVAHLGQREHSNRTLGLKKTVTAILLVCYNERQLPCGEAHMARK